MTIGDSHCAAAPSGRTIIDMRRAGTEVARDAAARACFVSRRAVLGGLVALLTPSGVYAQRPAAPPRVGWLSAGSLPDPFLDAFREGLRELGYVEGQNIVLEVRHANGSPQALQTGANELAQAKVALIVASLTAIRAVRAFKDILIVFTISGDPIAAGLVQSLARPGGNLTGSTFLSLEIAGKRVELLTEALPRLRSLAALSNTDHPGEKAELRATEAAAQKLGIDLVYVPFSQSPFGASPELDRALETVRRARPDAMVVFPEGATMANRAGLANFAVAQRLPSMFGWSEYTVAGGLMSYGASQRETHAPARRVRRQDPQRRGARRRARRAAHQVRARRQRADGEAARRHDPAAVAGAGRSSRRMSPRRAVPRTPGE